MNSKERTPNFLNFSILPKKEPGEGNLTHSDQTQTLAKPIPRGTDEEIAGSDNLTLSLRNPNYKLFPRHKAPIIDEGGTVYGTQKRKNIATLVDPRNPPSGGAFGGPWVSATRRQAPVAFGTYNMPQAIGSAPANSNPNPNPNCRPRFYASRQYYSGNNLGCVARGPDKAMGGTLAGPRQAVLKRGRWATPFAAVEREDPMTRRGSVADDNGGPIFRLEAENGGINGDYEDNVSMIDLSLKLGLP